MGTGVKIVAKNAKAFHDYFIEDRYETGIELAARLLQAGETVGIPTETVYGLAADATCDEAVAKLFAAKGRPHDNPLIVHIAAMEELEGLVREVPEACK